MFSINASIGRVPSLHHWGRGIETLPKRARSGPEYITDDFIFLDNSGSIFQLSTPVASKESDESLVQVAFHPSCSKISSIYFTSLVPGTLWIITSPSVSKAAGMSFKILFLLGTGVVVHWSAFHQVIVSFDIIFCFGKSCFDCSGLEHFCNKKKTTIKLIVANGIPTRNFNYANNVYQMFLKIQGYLIYFLLCKTNTVS